MPILRFTFALLAVLFALACGYTALAQTPPLTPGTVTAVHSLSCPSDFSSTMLAHGKCFGATLHCAAQGVTNVPDLGLTFGVEGPSTSSTVVFFSGGPGSLSDSDINQYVDNYYSADSFQVVQIDWASTGWGYTVSGSNANVLNAACRPAGFLKFVHDNLFHSGTTAGMCAQGISAGSAAVAYSLSWYGATLDNAELIAGPPLADIKTGCQSTAQPVTICPNSASEPECKGWPANGTLYTDARYEPTYSPMQPELVQISKDTGTLEANGNASCEDANVVSQDDPIWAAQGVAQPAIQNTSLAHTSMAAWICASTTGTANNSSPEGWLYYNTVAGSPTQNLPTPFAVNAIYSCAGAEGESGGHTLNGTSGRTAIETDMAGSCKHHQ